MNEVGKTNAGNADPVFWEKARAHLETEAQTMRAMKEGRWDRAFIDALEARCNN